MKEGGGGRRRLILALNILLVLHNIKRLELVETLQIKIFIRNNKFIRNRVTITFPYAGVSDYSASAYPKVHPELLAEL